jgi:hypothetical protein
VDRLDAGQLGDRRHAGGSSFERLDDDSSSPMMPRLLRRRGGNIGSERSSVVDVGWATAVVSGCWLAGRRADGARCQAATNVTQWRRPMSQDPETDDRTPVDPEDEDTEGHSLAMLAGLDALGRARQAESKRGKAPDEDLKPLTKPFPSMKNERRK